MSRDRPAVLPRAVADPVMGRERDRGLKHAELAHLKRFSGAAFMGWLTAPFGVEAKDRARLAPKFIRKGYEASIIDNLNDFYAARPRPWRPRGRDSCGPTFKERLKMRRRQANAR